MNITENMTKPGTSNLLGQISIPPPPVNDEYYLKIALNSNIEVTKKNLIGFRDYRLELARTIYDSVRAASQSKPLLYYIYYPSHKPIPTISAIWFNSQSYCPDLESNGIINATIELGHIVYPASNNSWLLLRNSSSYRIDNPSQDRLSFLSHSRSTSVVEFANNECGITNYYTDDTNRLYPIGQETFPGQWPWVVALFKKPQKYRCVGSVLTTTHIITVAKCLDRIVNPNDLIVVLGLPNLSKWTEKNVIHRKVANYTIHPDYAYSSSADSDLAIVILSRPVEYSPFIKPICLWSGSTNLQNLINNKGYVVGWRDICCDLTINWDYQINSNLRMARIPIVSQETCLRSNQIYFNLTSDRTFCAGGNICCSAPGGIGTGLVIFDNTTGHYHLRGIISRKPFCNANNYIVYVDVAKYISWIQQQISTT
ncbi:serine protease gd isoform X2 [Monomorium pharaonis]|nr:serine protease gd isoform X2 [Monomorium pharaonis]